MIKLVLTEEEATEVIYLLDGEAYSSSEFKDKTYSKKMRRLADKAIKQYEAQKVKK